jgi:hypothetical protein
MFWNNSAPRRGRPAASLRDDDDDDERCEAGNENSTAAEEAVVVAVDTVKRPSGSITRAYVRERRRTREECFLCTRARKVISRDWRE